MGASGDEWKYGTPYEDEEQALHRSLRETAAALQGFADAAKCMVGALRRMAAAHAARRLASHGLAHEEALQMTEECAMIAAAEGRNIPRALGDLIRRHAEVAHSTTEAG